MTLLDRAVLAGGIDALEDDQDRLPRLGPQPVLEVGEVAHLPFELGLADALSKPIVAPGSIVREPDPGAWLDPEAVAQIGSIGPVGLALLHRDDKERATIVALSVACCAYAGYFRRVGTVLLLAVDAEVAEAVPLTVGRVERRMQSRRPSDRRIEAPQDGIRAALDHDRRDQVADAFGVEVERS